MPGRPKVARLPRGATEEERFWSKVDKSGDCWLWLGSLNEEGYGKFHSGRSCVRAHRYAYKLLVGPIPPGLNLDHLCHTRDESCRLGNECPHRRCVNPAHLEPVTQRENVHRSPLARSVEAAAASIRNRTHCPRNHPYDEANTGWRKSGHRYCRACNRERVAHITARKKVA
jgi:hypothetical protein